MRAGLVEDLGTGEYRAAFSATAAGVYVVAVQHGGRNIAGSPFTAAVAPAAVCAATSAVALAPAAVTAGQQARRRPVAHACTPARSCTPVKWGLMRARVAPMPPARRARQAGFMVRALDRFGNPVLLAGAAALGARGFQATLAPAGADPEPLALALAGAPGAAACAELCARFQANAAGPATLAVTCAGASVRGSPWQARGLAQRPGRALRCSARSLRCRGRKAASVAHAPGTWRATAVRLGSQVCDQALECLLQPGACAPWRCAGCPQAWCNPENPMLHSLPWRPRPAARARRRCAAFPQAWWPGRRWRCASWLRTRTAMPRLAAATRLS